MAGSHYPAVQHSRNSTTSSPYHQRHYHASTEGAISGYLFLRELNPASSVKMCCPICGTPPPRPWRTDWASWRCSEGNDNTISILYNFEMKFIDTTVGCFYLRWSICERSKQTHLLLTLGADLLVVIRTRQICGVISGFSII